MVRNANPDGTISSLNADQLDVCFKYIYKGMEDPKGEASAAMLKWHEAAFKKGGLGSIIRVLTEKPKKGQKGGDDDEPEEEEGVSQNKKNSTSNNHCCCNCRQSKTQNLLDLFLNNNNEQTGG